MRQSGLDFQGEIIADGKLHRFNCECEKGEASWLVAHSADNFLAAAFGCWRRQINETWNSSKCNGSNLSKEEWADLRRRMDSAQKSRRTEEERLQSDAKLRASLALSSGEAVFAHDYLERKKVDPHGEMRIATGGKEDGCLVLPLRDAAGVIWSVQFIAPDKRFSGGRDKDFIFGGRVNGCFYAVSDREDGPLVICEGYATGASIHEATGYATVCAMFCGNLLPVAKSLRAQFSSRLIIIAADNDRFSEGNPGVSKGKAAAEAIKAALAVPTFADSDIESSDFNDLALLSGKSMVKQVLTSAVRQFMFPQSSLPAIRNACALLQNTEIVTPHELVEGVIHRGCKTILGSSSKARKTWILMDLALSVSSGVKFWRWETIQGRVLYINFEILECFVRSRIQTICKFKEIQSPTGLDIWTLRGYAAPLWRLLPEIIATVQNGEYSLIVIDPIYKGLGGRDENSAGDISELCNELERLAVATGAAIVFAAHYSKGNQAAKEAQDRIGGSGVFARDADSIITLTKHETEGCFTVDLILRNHHEQQPFVVEWKFPLMIPADHLSPEDLKSKGGRTKSLNIKDLCEAIKDTSPYNPISISAWAAAAEVNRNTLTGYTPDLRKAGYVATVGNGSSARQYLTDKGKQFIGLLPV